MIAGLKPYPVMKDSGVEWLGKIPDHWTEKRAKYFYREADERSTTGEEELLSVSHKTGVTPRKQSVTMFMAESTVGYKLCQPNDVASNTMWVFMGALGVSKQVGLVSPSYGVYRPIRPGDLLPEYVDRLLRVDGYKAEYTCRSTGINSSRLRLYPGDFLRIPIVCPPISEQTAIVRYLDHVDRRVRRLVRAKRKLIALLTEQKQAIIHRAVTRGLDPDVPLKESGVEWLGEVPAHWEVRRLKQVTTPIEQGWSPQCDAQEALGGDWGILKVGCVNRDDFDVHQNKRLPKELEPRKDLQIRDGDILVSRANTRELLGLAALVVDPRPRILLCDKLFRLRARGAFADPEFLVKAMRARPSRDQIETQTNGASDSMQNIGQGVIRNLLLALPPMGEQREIVAYIASATSAIGGSIASANREIDLLTEYRTRLTADVVTGKLDVREAAAALPEIDPLAADDEPDTLNAASEADLDDLDAVEEEAP